MTRTVALCFEYVGPAFNGSQLQPHGRSVQGELEAAWLKLTNESSHWVFAGRTDAGVHALAQVAHIRTETHRDLDTIVRAMNALTIDDLCVHEAWEMPSSFHARFSARQRSYRYLIDINPTPAPLLAQRVLTLNRPLDLTAMQQALTTLVGVHDFAAFTGAGHEGSTIRQCMLAQIEPIELFGRELQSVVLQANAFTKHMIRNIIGTLLKVGNGRLSLAQWMSILEGRDRRKAGATAQAHGLYLESISYDPAIKPLNTSTRWDGKTYFRTYHGQSTLPIND